MVVYTFDNTLDGLLSAVFDAFYNHEMPNELLTAGKALPLFCDHIHEVNTDENKSKRVWKGLENKLTHLGLSIITISFLSEDNNLNYALFSYICKAFTNKNKISIEKNISDPDVLICTQTYRRVCFEAKRMKQFLRFQKAKDGTYLGVIHPDFNVLPLIIEHFKDRFNDQCFLIYDAKRGYGFYYEELCSFRLLQNFDCPFGGNSRVIALLALGMFLQFFKARVINGDFCVFLQVIFGIDQDIHEHGEAVFHQRAGIHDHRIEAVQ